MRTLPAVVAIFLTFVQLGFKSKRSKVFWVVSFIPPCIILIMLLAGWANPNIKASVVAFVPKLMLLFYLELLIPLLALFYGVSIIAEEVDNKTLVYLTTCPVSKISILLGKFGGYFGMCLMITAAGLLATFALAYPKQLQNYQQWQIFWSYLGISALALFSYQALFTFLGSLMKKAILFGLFLVFGWEKIVQYLPGSTQKLTFVHYLKSLLPPMTEPGTQFLVFHLEPSPTGDSILILLVAGTVLLLLACLVFRHKEYILADSV